MVSISAPARDAIIYGAKVRRRRFNQRTRTGCDFVSRLSSLDLLVSISAPARDAISDDCQPKTGQGFQSAHPHGMRFFYYLSHFAHVQFQSAHPHGMRFSFTGIYQSCYLFQSAHSQGVRLKPQQVFMMIDKFQSVHSQGVRYRTSLLNPGIDCFNQRTRTGCDVWEMR